MSASACCHVPWDGLQATACTWEVKPEMPQRIWIFSSKTMESSMSGTMLGSWGGGAYPYASYIWAYPEYPPLKPVQQPCRLYSPCKSDPKTIGSNRRNSQAFKLEVWILKSNLPSTICYWLRSLCFIIKLVLSRGWQTSWTAHKPKYKTR